MADRVTLGQALGSDEVVGADTKFTGPEGIIRRRMLRTTSPNHRAEKHLDTEISPSVPMKVEPARVDDISDMPEEFKSRPKLKYLWLSGQGRLSSKKQKMLDKAMEQGHMKLSDEDWTVLQSIMPDSIVKDFEPSRTKALTMAKPGPDDQYLNNLVNDAYRKQEVDRVMEGIRTTSIGVGATFGALFGSSAGPAGTIGGGALGAAGGSAFVDGVENATKMILDRIFPLTGQEKTFTTMEIARRAATEGLIDTAASGVGVYAPFVAKKLKQRMLGITGESMAMKASGERLGITMLPLQVGRQALANYTNVMARIPFIGGPIRKKMIEQNAQIAGFVDSLPGRVSAKKMSDADVGVELDIVAQQNFEKHMTGLKDRQLKLKTSARKLGAFVNMNETSSVAQRWLDHYSQSDFVSTDKNIIKVLNKIVDVSKNGKISLDKWDDDLMAGIRNEIDKLDGGEGTRAMVELMEAARLDLAGSGQFGLKQLAMDKAWEAGFQKYESIAAKKFMMIDRNRFKQGVLKLGTRNPDELVGLLIGGQSPNLAFQVRGIVGDEAMRDLGARYLDRNLQTSRMVNKGGIDTDFDLLAKNLGLDNPKGGRFGVTKEMLRTSGVTPDMLQEFIKVGKAASATDIPDASLFLSRRVALAGIGGLTGAAGLGVMSGVLGPQSMLIGLGLTLVARHGSKIIANPENIRLATRALDANTDQAVRRSSLMRLYRLLLSDQPGVEQMREEEAEPDLTQMRPGVFQ